MAGLAGGGISIEGVPTTGTASIVDIIHNDDRRQRQHGDGRSGVHRRPAHLRAAAGRHRGTRGQHVPGADRQLDRLAQPDVLLRAVHTATRRPLRDSAGWVAGPTQYAEIQITARPYWDLANLSGSQFSPSATVLSSQTGPSSSANYLSGTNNVNYNVNGNSFVAPAFVNLYFNTDRRHAYQVGETNGEATLDLGAGGARRGRQLHPAAIRAAVRSRTRTRQPGQGRSSATTTSSDAGANGAGLCAGSGASSADSAARTPRCPRRSDRLRPAGVRPTQLAGARIGDRADTDDAGPAEVV